MSTVLLSGVGDLGGWALEFLARTPGIDRIVTIKRNPWSGPSKATMAMIGSVFQGQTKAFEHHQVDLVDTDRMARLLEEVRPDAIIHSATVQSPRKFMNAEIDPARRAAIRSATFGLWLPWHLLPAVQLTEAIDKAGVETHVVNASFPDVVNTVVWKHFGHGPAAGAGNVEVCAARILRYAMEASASPAEDIEVSLVGSHALLAYGPDAGVPHHFQLRVADRDVTADYDLGTIIMSWPERVDWGRTDVFSLFAASAVKNATALLGLSPPRTHVTAPHGLPGGYPALVEGGRIELDLPEDLSRVEAVAINEGAARWDGIDHIDSDGTVVYTDAARAAMAELGHHCESVTIADLAWQSERLQHLYESLITPR
jgi:hypothetical protein